MAELDELVDYLIKPYKKDEDKAYVLLNWIVNFVDYDEYRYKKIEENNATPRDLSEKIPEQGDILKTRLGVCEDISDLYVQMLGKAQIKAHKITGCLTSEKWKKGKDCDNPHAWVGFSLDDQWYLADPTLAMGAASVLGEVNTKRRYKHEVKKRERMTAKTYDSRNRRLNTAWFKTDPAKMAQDHQPEVEEWLLLKTRDRKNQNLK